MLGAATWGFKYAARIAVAVQTEQPQKLRETTLPAEESLIVAPPVALHLADVRSIFKLAAERRISLGSVEYPTETKRPGGMRLKHIVLHVDDEYPRLKAFVAELLEAMPHVQLDEIQIEQAPAPQPASKVLATIKLSLAYRVDEPETTLKGAAAGS